ncbi:MAG: TonB-dependent receptor plug domain-containing protein [Sphingomonadales bacterium]
MQGVTNRLVLCGALGLAALPSLAVAQEREDEVEEIVVIATKTENPLSRIGSSVSVITSTDIEQRQAAFLDDILRTVPGVSVSRNGGVGGVTSIFMRGAASGNTLVLIDGVEVNDAAAPGGPFNFASLSTGDIERVEVLRGPQSLLYGSRALGGVINIITKKGGPGFQVSGSAEYGSFETFRGHVNVSGGVDRFTYALSGSAFSNDGISAADKKDGNSEKDGLENYTFSGRFNARPHEAVAIDGHVRINSSEAEFDTFDFFAGGIVDGDNLNDATEIEGGGSLTLDLFDGKFQGIFKGGRWSLDRDSFQDGERNIAALGKRQEFSFQGNVLFNADNILTVGAEHEKTSMDFTFFSPFGNFPTVGDANIDSFFGQFQTTVMDGLTMTAGLRHDDHSTFGGVTTFRFTGAYNLEQTGATLRGTYGEAFKAPSLFDIFDPFSGNLALLPEENKSWDAGVEQRLLDGRMTAQATYFDVDTKNLIGFDFATFTSANTAASRARGVELSLSAHPVEGLDIVANYTLTSTRDKGTGERLVRRPKHLANVEATYGTGGRFSGSLGVTYTGKKLDTGGITLDDHFVAEARGAYKVTDKIEFFGRVENLFDADYQEIFGFGTPGVSAFFGLRLAS